MDMKEIREKIDAIDDSIVKAFEERMTLCGDIAEYKKKNGVPIYHPEREKQIIDRITKDLDNGMAECTRELYEKLFEISRSYQEKRIK